jgi:hypothetical protein
VDASLPPLTPVQSAAIETADAKLQSPDFTYYYSEPIERRGLIRGTAHFLRSTIVVLVLCCGIVAVGTIEVCTAIGPATTAGGFKPETNIRLDYTARCGECGFTVVMESLETEKDSDRFRIGLTVQNTGEQGNLGFELANWQVFALTEAQVSKLEAASSGREHSILYEVAQSELVDGRKRFFVDRSGGVPDLAAGESWQGRLVFVTKLSPDATAIVLAAAPVTSGSRRLAWYSWNADENQELVIRLARE